MTITKADDFPIHQLPAPVAHVGTERNFYDRYFFHGYARDGSFFFAATFGMYPNLNVADASFTILKDGVQRNFHASRLLELERLDLHVGPITIEVLEPLKKLRFVLQDNDSGLSADFVFQARTRVIEEPRLTLSTGPRVLMDSTRMTQHGTYDGWVQAGDDKISLSSSNVWGVRDRSWGVRPVGASDSQPVVPFQIPQIYMLWAPLHFDHCTVLYQISAYENGKPWAHHAMILPLDAEPVDMVTARDEVEFKSGTRHAKAARLFFETPQGGEITFELTPKLQCYMSGLGYLSEKWGLGVYQGDLVVGHETWTSAEIDETILPFLHVEAFCEVTMTEGGKTHQGCGVLEQMILGPHAPSGFKDLLDTAP